MPTPAQLYPDLDSLLAPETLGRFSQQEITSVSRQPLVAGHSASGSKLFQIRTNAGAGPTFVLKRISLEWDWIMRATGDCRGREMVIFQNGFLDTLPPELTHAVLACAHDGDGWALLMRDMGAFIYPPRDPFRRYPVSPVKHEALLHGLAALHAQNWEQPLALDAGVGFCQPASRFHALSRAIAERESAAGTDAPYLEVMSRGWEVLPTLIDPGLAREITALADNPDSLAAVHDRFPMTAVHGDPRPANLGFVPQDDGTIRVLLYDWQLAGPGWATTDLAWYLYCAGSCDAVVLEPSIAMYRSALAAKLGPRFDNGWWEPLLGLGLLGQVVRSAYDMAWWATAEEETARLAARGNLAWWSARAEEGLALLDSLA